MTLTELDYTVPLGRALLRAAPPIRRHVTVNWAWDSVIWQLRVHDLPYGPVLTGPVEDYWLDLSKYALRARLEARR